MRDASNRLFYRWGTALSVVAKLGSRFGAACCLPEGRGCPRLLVPVVLRFRTSRSRSCCCAVSSACWSVSFCVVVPAGLQSRLTCLNLWRGSLARSRIGPTPNRYSWIFANASICVSASALSIDCV
jgi:hypothetical protein